MQRIAVVILLSVLNLVGFSQEVKTIRAYEYENFRDSLANFDTVLVEITEVNRDGVKTRRDRYRDGVITGTTINHGDSLTLVYPLSSDIDSDYRTEYRNDKYGNCVSIISLEDTMLYKLEYSDSLITSSKCISGCTYRDVYEHNEDGLLAVVERIWDDGRVDKTEWQYDERLRLTKWISGFGGTIISTTYNDAALQEIETWTDSSETEEREKYVRQLNEKLDVVHEECYVFGKLMYRKFYEYEYY